MEKPEACVGCPLFASTEGPVWGDGPKDAKIVAIGEAPGEEEGYARKPFIGGSGKVLRAQFAHAGIDVKEVFLSNVVKCRPTARSASGQVVNRQPTEAEIRHCARYLVGELQLVKPNVIIALGNIPLQTLTGAKRTITDMRSVPLEGNKRIDGLAERFKVVGTFHPAFVMRQQDFWPVAVFDLVRAKSESAFPDIRRRQWKNVIHASVQEHGAYLLKKIREPRYGGWKPYFHDLETTGLDGKKDAIRCVGISADDKEIFVFDYTNETQSYLADLHKDPDLMCVGQNSEMFDIPFQEDKGYEFRGPTYDTLLGWHWLNAALPKDLAFIGATVTDEPYWKDKSMYKSGEDALQYGCGKDIHATARAFIDQLQEMDAIGHRDLFMRHVMPLQPVLRAMHRRGMKKDIRKAAAWHVVLTRKADEYDARLKKGLSDSTFNVDSPKQLMDLLYRRMGLPVQYKQTRDGFRPTVDADAIDALAVEMTKRPQLAPVAPLFKLIRAIRTLRKWDATFVQCKMDDQYKVHFHFSSAKAANGRLNSYDPNGQNFPSEVREIIVPDDEDHVLIARDWSQIEWRLAMALSGDKQGLDALANGRDPHNDAYSAAFGKAYDEVTKKERFEAKTINYGLLYGRGDDSLAAGRAGHPETAMDPAFVHDYKLRFLSTFSGYNAFRGHIERQVRNRHYVETAWKRRRYWYTRQNMPEAYNYPISGSAASMMYEILMELETQLPNGAELRMSVHDEVLIHSVKDQKVLQQAIDCTHEIMERVFPQILESCVYPDTLRSYYPNGWFCPSDCHIGMNWKATKGWDKEGDKSHVVEMDLRKRLGVTVR